MAFTLSRAGPKCNTPFQIDSFSFINSSVDAVREYSREVACGDVEETVINEKFKEIQSKEYTKIEAIAIIQKLTISKNIVHLGRTDYQVPCGEAIIYLTNFITVEGSINLKILYALFGYLIDCEKYEDSIKNLNLFENSCCKEIFPEVADRLESLNKKDKTLELAHDIKEIYKVLTDND